MNLERIELSKGDLERLSGEIKREVSKIPGISYSDLKVEILGREEWSRYDSGIVNLGLTHLGEDIRAEFDKGKNCNCYWIS